MELCICAPGESDTSLNLAHTMSALVSFTDLHSDDYRSLLYARMLFLVVYACLALLIASALPDFPTAQRHFLPLPFKAPQTLPFATQAQ